MEDGGPLMDSRLILRSSSFLRPTRLCKGKGSVHWLKIKRRWLSGQWCWLSPPSPTTPSESHPRNEGKICGEISGLAVWLHLVYHQAECNTAAHFDILQILTTSNTQNKKLSILQTLTTTNTHITLLHKNQFYTSKLGKKTIFSTKMAIYGQKMAWKWPLSTCTKVPLVGNLNLCQEMPDIMQKELGQIDQPF